MARYFCHEHPDVLSLETRVVDARPGAVVLEQTPFYPGGGGQLADHGTLRWSGGEAAVTGLQPAVEGRFWHVLAEPVEPTGAVVAVVEPVFRTMMTELHTGTHILNALVFQQFDRALVTGAQLNDDATARMDFDLPDADNDKLRALEAGLNDLIRQDLPCATPMSRWPRPQRSTVSSGAARWRPRQATTGSSASWRSSGSTVRRAAGRTWPRPPGHDRCGS
jgi:misacylated tRNA(Ala) deacylase